MATRTTNVLADMDSKAGCLNILLDSCGNLLVKILNVHSGRIIKTVKHPVAERNQNVSVTLNDLSSGTYVLNVFKDNSFVRSFHYNKN